MPVIPGYATQGRQYSRLFAQLVTNSQLATGQARPRRDQLGGQLVTNSHVDFEAEWRCAGPGLGLGRPRVAAAVAATPPSTCCRCREAQDHEEAPANAEQVRKRRAEDAASASGEEGEGEVVASELLAARRRLLLRPRRLACAIFRDE